MTAREFIEQAAISGRNIASVARVGEWWQYKLAGTLGTVYLIAGFYEVPTASLWWRLLVLTAAFVSVAFYVCVLNDVTDLEDDWRSGKRNRMAGHSRRFMVLTLAIGPALGLLLGVFLITGPLARSFYAANWLAFTLYSVPPFRFKVRGLAGVLADACGGQMLPGLWVSAYIAESMGQLLDARLGVCLAVWGLALGLRGIICHQIEDRERDRKADVATLIARGDAAFVQKVVRWVVFPIETAALVGLLILFGSPLPWLFLGLHLLLQWMRIRSFGIQVILVEPRPNGRAALAEYYQLLLPAAILLTRSSVDHWTLLLLLVHLCLFPDVTRRFFRNVGHFVRWQGLDSLWEALKHLAHHACWQWLPRLGRILRVRNVRVFWRLP